MAATIILNGTLRPLCYSSFASQLPEVSKVYVISRQDNSKIEELGFECSLYFPKVVQSALWFRHPNHDDENV